MVPGKYWTTMNTDHEKYMREALKEARRAWDEGEIPIGAVVVCEGRIIARAHNQTETLHDPTAHAEMLWSTVRTTPSAVTPFFSRPCCIRGQRSAAEYWRTSAVLS